MSIALDPPPATEVSASRSPAGPSVRRGLIAWLATTDHKRIGVLYGATALFFFGAGGVEAVLMRLQLARPDGTVLDANTYNQLFTMHGTTMIFLVVQPIGTAFANYLVPLQVGARDVAFPRLNALSYWLFLAGGVVINTGFVGGGAADGGWFMYAPNSGRDYSPTLGVDFWTAGLLLTGAASIIGAINLIVTILNMRAPGMTLLRMPIFTWMALVTSFLVLFALTVLSVALYLLLLERRFDAAFFDVAKGADPLLWQHLFWLFGHPEVYLMVLPSFGIISEIIPTFSGKPLFGYPMIVFSGAVIGFVGWGVWAHHMFSSGLGPITVAVFSISTMAIAVPTGVKIINWLLTMWGGTLRFPTPMLFAVGEVTMFTLGGLSGVTHSVAPSDTQQTDTYYVVAHFHYVLFGGALFGLVAGIYYWWPKIFGRLLDERLGTWHFWLMMIGFNLTFGPMHVLGLQGQPRRMYTYTGSRSGDGFFNLEFWNLISTIGTFVIAASFVVFAFNVVGSRRRVTDDPDPWAARSLEWMTATPVPAWNYSSTPRVESLDEFWYRKHVPAGDGYAQVRTGRDVVAETESAAVGRRIVLPSPSLLPLLLACSLMLVVYGLIVSLILTAIGGVVAVAAISKWALTPCFPTLDQ